MLKNGSTPWRQRCCGAAPVREALPANRSTVTSSPGRSRYMAAQGAGGDIATAAKMLPNWPGTIALRKKCERALYRENHSPARPWAASTAASR